MADERPVEGPLGDEAEHDKAEGHSFYPFHVIDTAMIAYVLAGVLLTLAILHPFVLHEPADPLRTPPGIKPEWYFLPMYQGIKYVPPVVGVLASSLVFVIIILWPFIDVLIGRFWRWRRFHVAVGAAALFVVLVLGLIGYVSERTFTVGGQHYHVDILGIPHASAPEEPSTTPHK